MNNTQPRTSVVEIKIIEWLEESTTAHTFLKTQGGPVFKIDLTCLSPVARKIAEACAVVGATRFHDRASILGYSKREKGEFWTARQREVWGEELAKKRTRMNILLPLWGGLDVRGVTDPHQYFELVAEMPIVKCVDPETIQSPPKFAGGLFHRI